MAWPKKLLSAEELRENRRKRALAEGNPEPTLRDLFPWVPPIVWPADLAQRDQAMNDLLLHGECMWRTLPDGTIEVLPPSSWKRES
jgi:hypothetical protein